MPGFGYYHPPRVVTPPAEIIIMAIRKSIAAQFSKAARALEKDQSKEQAGRLILALRVGIANAIMPNIPPVKR
jgi:regulator of protease activity HflC (stomatin/prohibitin superfamily)